MTTDGPATDPVHPTQLPHRLPVRKTYKLYVGGKFPRSESGRSYVVSTPDGHFLANAALASRKDARDAVAAALSAGVWTEKGSRILWMAKKLRAGVVWANTFNRFDPASPFGGYKESGYGREGGRQGLAAYLRPSGSSSPQRGRIETKGAK